MKIAVISGLSLILRNSLLANSSEMNTRYTEMSLQYQLLFAESTEMSLQYQLLLAEFTEMSLQTPV